MILTDADELRATLALVMRERDEAITRYGITVARWGATERERDEARAEVERLTEERDEARAEVERLTEERDRVARELRRIDEHGSLRAAIRAAAERQREACAKEAYFYAGLGWSGERNGERIAEMVRATPLVTEVEP